MKKRLFSVLAALMLATSADAKPPTLDPTYGLPLPATTAAPATVAASGNWIWGDHVRDNQTALFRRSFTLNAFPKIAFLHITADDLFTLYVNGQQAYPLRGAGEGSAAGNDWAFVHSINIAPFLTTGINTLQVTVVNNAGAAGLLVRLDMPGETPIITDESWRVLLDPNPASDWTQSSFDDSFWAHATVVAPAGQGIWQTVSDLQGWPGLDTTAPYLAHITLPVERVQDIHDGGGKITGASGLTSRKDAILTVTPPAEGTADLPSFVIDFGQEVAGRLELTGLTSGTILAGTGESYEEATQHPWRGLHTVLLAPGSASYTPYSAFRYAKLIVPASSDPTPLRLRIALDHKYYPVVYKGSFSCSDPLLTKLWYTGAYTAHLCMQEDIWDAPKRDRARWIGDLHISGAVINDVFADRFLMEQTMERLRSDAKNGHVNAIPGYSCAWICTLADFHRHLGDDAYLNKQHDSLISLLEFMRSELDDKGLFANKSNSWSFVDWVPGFDGNTPEAYAATHLFYAKAAQEAVYLLREMGDKQNADKYAAWSNELADSARKYLSDSDTGTYGDRLQENAMAVYSGVATAQQRDQIYRTILALNSPAWDKRGITPAQGGVMTPYYGNYVLQALSMTGHTDTGLKLLRSYWGGMLEEGATTFWEGYDTTWPKKNYHLYLGADNIEGTNTSLCHGWSAAPTSWLTDQVLGVRPTSGGFKTVVIQPELADLQWAQGSVPTPRGAIDVRATRMRNGLLRLALTLPPGTTAGIALAGSSVLVNGQPTAQVISKNRVVRVNLDKAGRYVLVAN